MARSRVEIQKDVNGYRASVESRDMSLNSPLWDDKSDPRYIEILELQVKEKLELANFERELAEAKARGEKGRTSAEIREEISEEQSKLNNFLSTLNSNRAKMNSLQWAMLNPTVNPVVRHAQCTINALQRELNEAVEEEKVEEKAEADRITALYAERLRDNPNDAKLYNERGLMFLGKGFFDMAIKDYSQSIRINPDDAEAYQCRGMIYIQKEEYNKAIEDFNKALKLTPDDSKTLFFRGSAYIQKDDIDKAIADYNEAIRLDSNNALAYINRSLAYNKKGNYDQAVADCEAAVRIDPNLPGAEQVLQNARKLKEEVEQERAERARNYEQLVQEKNSASTEDEYNNLANQFRAMNGYENAAELAKECDIQEKALIERRKEQKKKRVITIISAAIAAIGILIGIIAYNSQQNSVTILGGTAVIKEGEFTRKQLVYVSIPDSVTSIGDKAFRRNKLARVTIPGSVTSIGGSAFAGNRLTSIEIGSNVTLGSDAFGYDFEAFYRGNGMAAGTYTRYDAKSEDWSAWHVNLRFQSREGNITITGYNGNGDEAVIPAEISGYPVTVIGQQAFRGRNLTGVTIPNSVITIEDSAFSRNKLAGVILPNSVTSVGVNAYDGNPVTSVTIGANVTLGSGSGNIGALGDNTGFNGAYSNNGKRAGTYTRPNTNSTTWTRK